VESKEARQEPIFRRIFIDGKGRSVGRALAFFWVGYSLSVVSAALFVVSGIGRGLGGASDFSDVTYVSYASFIYLGLVLALVSQLWFLLLKPYWEMDRINETVPLVYTLTTALLLIPSTVFYLLSIASILDLYALDNDFLFRRILWVNFYLGAAFLLFGPVHIIGLAGYRYAYGRGDSADPSQ